MPVSSLRLELRTFNRLAQDKKGLASSVFDWIIVLCHIIRLLEQTSICERTTTKSFRILWKLARNYRVLIKSRNNQDNE